MEESKEMMEKMLRLAEERRRYSTEGGEKLKFYKDVNSMKKNVQFFFWLTIVYLLITVVIFLSNL